MHEASGDAISETEPTGQPGAGRADAEARADAEPTGIESLPLAERAPRYQAAADRLRDELERSDPARGDV